MKASKRDVNWFMRLRRSSKPKLMLGSWSAMDGTSCEVARIELLSEDSKVVIVCATERQGYMGYIVLWKRLTWFVMDVVLRRLLGKQRSL
jgi:hypothetical protein